MTGPALTLSSRTWQWHGGGDMMQWDTLLSAKRLGRDRTDTPRPERSPFQRDYDRIVFSSAFRRMQDKTQVFPLAESDYVRTRLTHSLEAACVGRSLGTMIGERIAQRPTGSSIHPSDVGAIVAAACLAHDIGNPPFGHSGEDAIRLWFERSEVARPFHALLSEEQRADFTRFEGNAQGFRVLSALQMPDNRGGLQLTCATLGAFAKYPVTAAGCGKGRVSTRKSSFFRSEIGLFREVAAETGMLPRPPEANGADPAQWCRHPLAFAVEAADDICYRLVDFEDGVRIGILSYEEVRDAFAGLLVDPKKHLLRAEKMQREKERIEFLRAVAIGDVLAQVCDVFLAHEEALLHGEFETPLIECTAVAEPLRVIEKRSRETIYSSARGLEIEVAGFQVIGGLLDLVVGAVEERAARREGGYSGRTRTLLRLIPEQFIGPGREPSRDPYTRLQLMTDFIAGMTDSYAVGLYKKLCGISLPGQR
ncbi:MAG TPA: deoxyguanosinetriphosphate triphosphohydrolase [Chthoniobacteraceae bacterium]|nr:deoxyguanosinetriphosphate triphosphohydrolase [Chthoniobacteraceae bacterium]